ncbi:Uncharacterised protein at_DN0735 [Pycnogonum litorale]
MLRFLIIAFDNPFSKTDLVYNIQVLLIQIHEGTNSVFFQWVRAHCGIGGNEQADLMAKRGVTMKTKICYNKIPKSFVKAKLRKINAMLWQEDYSNSRENFTKSLFPTLHSFTVFTSMVVPSFYTTQFLTGHGRFNSYLHRFHIIDSLSCHLCGFEEQTPVHLLFRCPETIRRRHAFMKLAIIVHHILWPPKLSDISAILISVSSSVKCAGSYMLISDCSHLGCDSLAHWVYRNFKF